MEKMFTAISEKMFTELNPGEILTLSFKGETSQYIRLNNARIRQTGLVDDAVLGMQLSKGNRICSGAVTFSTNLTEDINRAGGELQRLRNELPQLPEDPFIVKPSGEGSSLEIKTALGLPFDQAVEALLPAMLGVDLVGIWASGKIYYGSSNSLGQKHWFETNTFSLDYSLVASDHKMVKGTFAGTDWDQAAYEKNLAESKNRLKLMSKQPVKVPPGKYRTWFGPQAVVNFLNTFNWMGLSEAAIQQGCSGFGRMRNEGARLSSKLSLSENFSRGLAPRFNSLGEVAENISPLIVSGELINSMVSSRSSAEYGVPSNQAEESEIFRSLFMESGDLAEKEILSELDTGLFLSNLHYLNWSDVTGGRITGLTRYACFWVDKGEITGPLDTMRFDDTIYNFFGSELERVGADQELVPDVSTYEGRNSESILCPGMLVNSFALTL